MGKEAPKILYILHYFYNRGGTEIHTRALAKGLSSDFQIGILAPSGPELHLIENGELSRSYASVRTAWPLTPYRSVERERSLAQAILDFQPDLIHVQHFFDWPLSLFDQLKTFQKPIVASFHDYYAITPHYTLEGVADATETLGSAYALKIFQSDISPYLKRRREVLTRSLSSIQTNIVPSTFTMHQYESVFPNSYRVIEHGITSVPVVRQKNENAPRPFRFGCVGSLIPQKGWQSLFEAFPKFQTKHPGVELHFFGGGQTPPETAPPGVFFHGVYELQDLPSILGQFDVGVIPSVFPESFSLVLSELWGAGLPVAVSDIGALGERVAENQNGRKFKPGNVDDIAQTLSSFLEDESWRQWAIPAPRNEASMLNEYRDLYRELLT